MAYWHPIVAISAVVLTIVWRIIRVLPKGPFREPVIIPFIPGVSDEYEESLVIPGPQGIHVSKVGPLFGFSAY